MQFRIVIIILIHVRRVPSSPHHGASSGCGWRDGLQQWRVAANMLNKQPRTNDRGWSSTLGLCVGLTTPHRKSQACYILMSPGTWTDPLDKLPNRRNMDMRFVTYNISSLYKAGSLMTVSRELSRYWLDLVGVQEVRWEGSGTAPAGEYTFFYAKGNKNHEMDTGFFCIRESYQQLRWLSFLVI
jgi:hypothetical protein